MTCKDCIHYEMCGGFIPSDLDRDVFDYCREGRTDEIPDIEERCTNFKDKSRYIETPCKVGDILYFPISHRVIAYEVSKIKYDGDLLKIVTHNKLSGYQRTIWSQDVGTTIFLTKEEAEKALKEREDK